MMQRGVARVLLAKVASRSRLAPLAAASVLARSSSVLARSAVPFSPLAASPLLHKSKLAGLIAAAGSTTAACAFCSSSAAVAPAAATNEQLAADKGLPTVVLYQYEPCPYCCKVKAVLDYLRIPYEVVEVNPLTKKETKAFTDYRKVPVCKINGEVVVDSSAIISRLRELVVDVQIDSDSASGVSREEEDKWRQWVDQKLILLTPPNIYRTVPEALQAFDYCLTEGKFTPLERHMSKYAGAVIMYLIAKRSMKKYQIDDARGDLYAALDSWVSAVGDREFLGGTEPNMADLSVFGVLRAMDGLDTYSDLMANTRIKPWFTRMTDKVGPSSRIRSE